MVYGLGFSVPTREHGHLVTLIISFLRDLLPSPWIGAGIYLPKPLFQEFSLDYCGQLRIKVKVGKKLLFIGQWLIYTPEKKMGSL